MLNFFVKFCSTLKLILDPPQKSMVSLTFIISNSCQNQNNRKAIHGIAPRPLIFKFQQGILKFNDIYMSSSSAKTELEANYSDLKNRSFESLSFSQ